MENMPSNYSLLARLHGNKASQIFPVSAAILLLLVTIGQLKPKAKGVARPHQWLDSHPIKH